MNFRQFEALYWITRLGSFHAAAQHLDTSQPAISARIRELEQELGVTVFDRSGRKVRPTPKGHELQRYATQIMAIAAEIQQRVGTREALSGRIRLGLPAAQALTWLPGLLERVAQTYPGLVVEFTVETSELLEALMREGRLDVAVLAGPVSLPNVTAESLGQVPMAWLCSPRLTVPPRPMRAAELVLWPVISAQEGTRLHAATMEWFRAEGVEPARRHACSSLPTRIQLAVQGLGIALASPAAARRELEEGKLQHVATVRPLPSLEYVIAYSDIDPSPAGRIVADMAKALIAQKPDLQSFYSYYADSESPS
ncbi:LysR family transcriptional regulator [Paraburkholderia sp. JPY432]|uniref:LysR family transcriptional regulator n=1 Tax=Paraburkholderia youngii TaxID=2782701 RepID=UPI001595EC47|nr:LysR family transcriptional regulator [Paraburkholderia youngii]NVH74079.1 LysR family transcriptional regulator [Paraburkholderia youngii]